MSFSRENECLYTLPWLIRDQKERSQGERLLFFPEIKSPCSGEDMRGSNPCPSCMPGREGESRYQLLPTGSSHTGIPRVRSKQKALSCSFSSPRNSSHFSQPRNNPVSELCKNACIAFSPRIVSRVGMILGCGLDHLLG